MSIEGKAFLFLPEAVIINPLLCQRKSGNLVLFETGMTKVVPKSHQAGFKISRSVKYQNFPNYFQRKAVKSEDYFVPNATRINSEVQDLFESSVSGNATP
ncbi:hypothetical protein EGR_06550 [Echinococcus granulosus]|uniref:Uncharacterized protein n=1 Tax=Echinococcus granulosus TaxID=6210 RepID=W6UB08_ECHGR|nr:hypothetical protein EGR_06550 [Echinococcus granulosus]EUB58563.1 hypothetical protein EGR_06550 [Echinococcus granulosus]